MADFLFLCSAVTSALFVLCILFNVLSFSFDQVGGGGEPDLEGFPNLLSRFQDLSRQEVLTALMKIEATAEALSQVRVFLFTKKTIVWKKTKTLAPNLTPK